MKLIAHRGGLSGPENTLETLVTSAKLGADAVECDLRRTKDGTFVIFHDATLLRLAGVPAAVSDLTFPEMQGLLHGIPLLTLDALCQQYREDVPILLHIKPDQETPELAVMIAACGLPLIAGVTSMPMLNRFAKVLPSQQILAFMPHCTDYSDFYHAGAGIIRLWEQWLPHTAPDTVKAACPEATVFVMACCLQTFPEEGIPFDSMNGSINSLQYCRDLGADGVLLNDITLGIRWRESIQ